MQKPDREGGCAFCDGKTAPSLTLGFLLSTLLTLLNK